MDPNLLDEFSDEMINKTSLKDYIRPGTKVLFKGSYYPVEKVGFDWVAISGYGTSKKEHTIIKEDEIGSGAPKRTVKPKSDDAQHY